MNWVLLNYADYQSTGCIKKLLKSKGSLHKLAERGDQVAHSICIDLETALQVLTPKQLDYMLPWLAGYTQSEIAAYHQIDQCTVALTILNGVKRIKKTLNNSFITKQ